MRSLTVGRVFRAANTHSSAAETHWVAGKMEGKSLAKKRGLTNRRYLHGWLRETGHSLEEGRCLS